jgi:hypothetical protein
MGKLADPNTLQVQKSVKADRIRQHVIEQLNTYQSAIEELSDKEVEEIAGGGPKTQMFTYAGRLIDVMTIGYAGYSVAKTGRIF